MLQPGDHLPDFALRGPTREPITRADFAGRSGVLAFFPRAFTDGWRHELLQFERVIDALRSAQARVAGVSSDTWLENRRFAEQLSLTFPLLSDWPHAPTITAFGLAEAGGRARRATVVFDARSVVREVITDVNPAAHAQRALDLVRSIGEEPPAGG